MWHKINTDLLKIKKISVSETANHPSAVTLNIQKQLFFVESVIDFFR
jgi:hypothetical protein